MPAYPSGACVLQYEESVVSVNSVAVLARGEGMSVVGGAPCRRCMRRLERERL